MKIVCYYFFIDLVYGIVWLAILVYGGQPGELKWTLANIWQRCKALLKSYFEICMFNSVQFEQIEALNNPLRHLMYTLLDKYLDKKKQINYCVKKNYSLFSLKK